MTTTKTARLYETDIQRAQLMAAVRGEGTPDVLHAALDEFVANHRVELDSAFRAVQEAVLSNDREAVRSIFSASVDRLAAADSERVARLIAESGE